MINVCNINGLSEFLQPNTIVSLLKTDMWIKSKDLFDKAGIVKSHCI